MRCVVTFCLFLLLCTSLCYANLCTNPTINDGCNFYTQCLEPVVKCGPSGYPLGYGNKYCLKFSSNTYNDPKTKAWMESTRECLQRALVPYANGKKVSCSQLADIAFDSHPSCYTQPSNSICNLRNIGDLRRIVRTVDGSDFFSLRSAKQVANVIKICFGQIIFSTSSDEDEVLRFWAKKMRDHMEHGESVLIEADTDNEEAQG